MAITSPLRFSSCTDPGRSGRRDRRPVSFQARVALHESAHALVALELGFDVERASIEPTSDGQGEGETVWADPSPSAPPERFEAAACVHLAGMVSERIFFGHAEYHDEDHESALGLLEGIGRLGEILTLCARTRDILLERLTDLQVVAGALLDERELCGADLRLLLDERRTA